MASSLPHRGPLLVPSTAEVALIADLLEGHGGTVASGLRTKCAAVLDSHPTWRKPLR